MSERCEVEICWQDDEETLWNVVTYDSAGQRIGESRPFPHRYLAESVAERWRRHEWVRSLVNRVLDAGDTLDA